MNIHDIELPPLPPLHIAPSVEPVDYPEIAQALMDYARAAIEADRQRRGEPVAWIQRSYLNLIRESNVALHNVVVRGSILDGDGDVVPLFTAPQPAEPVKRKRRYAQGTALGEFGIIPMCDQVDDEPVEGAQ